MNTDPEVEATSASLEPRVIGHPFLHKLRACVRLSSDDELALVKAFGNVCELPNDTHIIRQGDRAKFVHVILRGWAARYEVLADGSRAVTAILLPGDLCDQDAAAFGPINHSIVTLTPATVAYLPNGQLEAIARTRPAVSQALWWSALADPAILQAWIVNIGRRDAFAAIGHFLCELHTRLRGAGLTRNSDFELPLTQGQIADMHGLTAVHVNRTLKRLRAEGYIRLEQRRLVIDDVARLKRATGFDSRYLRFANVSADNC